MSIVPFLSIFLFLASPAQASHENELLKGCEKISHEEWIKRYEETELKVIEAFEKNPKLSQAPSEKIFYQVVFPQDLPKSHPMRRAFAGCAEIFHDYQKAINNVQSMATLKKLDECYQDAYKINPPKILTRYMDCLKRVKY